MHDAAFARASVPTPIAILKLPLRPYSVGHSIWLQAAGNPLAEDSGAFSITAEHVIEAVWTCASGWRELATQQARWLTLLKLRSWGRRARREDLAGAAVEFQKYRRAGSSVPPLKPPEGGGRTLGAPLAATLVQFLVNHFGKSEEEALDYPLGLAYWHFAAHQEREGAMRIVNAAEMEFENWCEAREAANA